ncbi:MAG TPA: hypothetical protein VFG07_04820 [Thermoplasmata archaeon]|nr:hypothetical protein [Thermoplasmata archaeon]
MEPLPPDSPSRAFRSGLTRVGFESAVFVVSDLLLVLVVFSISLLALVTAFAVFRIELAREYASVGAAFGTGAQLVSAHALLAVMPPFMAIVLYLGGRAFRIPRSL